MKVKELIEKLQKLDKNQEIFFYSDWNYLQEDWTYFKEVTDDMLLGKWYFMKAWEYTFFEECYVPWDFEKIKKETSKSRRIAKRYMKYEWYARVSKEWGWYIIHLF